MSKNILVVARSNIGDACYDLVVVSALRRNFPGARITLLTSSRSKSSISGYRGLNKIFTYDKHTRDRGVLGRLRLLATLKKENFDRVVILKNTLMYKFLNAPSVWSLQKYLRRQGGEKNKHIVDIYLDFLRSHGLNVPGAVFDFSFTREEEEFCDVFLAGQGFKTEDSFIGILLFAAWSLKSWPLENWVELAGILQDRYGIKVINLGKRYPDSFGRAANQGAVRKIISAEDTTLKQAMALAKRCRLFIGPDSSLLHLGSCLGVETIGLYGPTPPERFYPYFNRSDVIVSKQKLRCMPCYPDARPRPHPCRGRFSVGACMGSISVNDVLEKVKQKLKL